MSNSILSEKKACRNVDIKFLKQNCITYCSCFYIYSKSTKSIYKNEAHQRMILYNFSMVLVREEGDKTWACDLISSLQGGKLKFGKNLCNIW